MSVTEYIYSVDIKNKTDYAQTRGDPPVEGSLGNPPIQGCMGGSGGPCYGDAGIFVDLDKVFQKYAEGNRDYGFALPSIKELDSIGLIKSMTTEWIIHFFDNGATDGTNTIFATLYAGEEYKNLNTVLSSASYRSCGRNLNSDQCDGTPNNTSLPLSTDVVCYKGYIDLNNGVGGNGYSNVSYD
jgi:hypothetical protein